MRTLLLATALLAAALPAQAASILLDFEEEPEGQRIEFVSAECDCVLLYEHGRGEDFDLVLTVRDFGVSDGDGYTDGQAVRVGDQGGSGGGLVMEFLVPVLAVSLDFGNDESDVSPVYDASLTGYDSQGGVLAQAFVTPNLDKLVNQTISITSASPIARAVFQLELLGDQSEHSPVVDNLVLTTVPDPGTVGLMLLGAAAVLTRRR
jgi:hypothetical protein